MARFRLNDILLASCLAFSSANYLPARAQDDAHDISSPASLLNPANPACPTNPLNPANQIDYSDRTPTEILLSTEQISYIKEGALYLGIGIFLGVAVGINYFLSKRRIG